MPITPPDEDKGLKRDWVHHAPMFGPEEFTLNGERYRATLEPDTHVSIMDEQGPGVWCGQLAFSDQRPDHFNGGARILRYGRSHDSIWWQPEPDCVRDRALADNVAATIKEILVSGYLILAVERLSECNHGHMHADYVDSVSMIEPTADAEYLGDLLGDIMTDVVAR